LFQDISSVRPRPFLACARLWPACAVRAALLVGMIAQKVIAAVTLVNVAAGFGGHQSQAQRVFGSSLAFGGDSDLAARALVRRRSAGGAGGIPGAAPASLAEALRDKSDGKEDKVLKQTIFDEARQKVAKLNEKKAERLSGVDKRIAQLARAMENVQLDLLKQEEEEGVDEREVQRLKEQHAKHKRDLEQAGSDILLLERDVAKQIVDIWQSAEKHVREALRSKLPDEVAPLQAMLEQVRTETEKALEAQAFAYDMTTDVTCRHKDFEGLKTKIATVAGKGYSRLRAEVALDKEQWDVDKALKRLAKESPKKSD